VDLIRVYRIPFSTNVERVALAAGHKGVAIEWIDVDPDDRSPVEAVSSQSLVPVLITAEGDVIADSPRILDWLEERFPEPSLLPADDDRRAEVRIFCDWFNGIWKRAPNAIADDGPTEQLAREMRAHVTLFENLLTRRDYLFGDFGLADVTAFPFLKYPVFGVASDDNDPFHRVLVDQMPLTDGSPLRAWANRVDAHPRS
jgi:glutathione S-transferase